jgi:predicted Zn-dependent protease
MTLRRITRVFTIVLSAGLLVHCAQTPVADSPDFARVSVQQEIRIGTAAAQAVELEYAGLKASAVQTYVSGLGLRLAKTSERPELPWQFSVLDSPEVNAFSLPGGHVYVSRGLLAYLDTEAQLAAILAHEIGHVVARHGVRHSVLASVDERGDRLGSVLEPALNGNPLSTQAWRAGYGSALELDADALAAHVLTRAGYPPQVLVDTLLVLTRQAQDDSVRARASGRATRHYHGLIETTAHNTTRLRDAVAEATRTIASAPREANDTYLATIAGIAFDDSVGDHVIRNHAVLDAAAGYGFEFPTRWQIQMQAGRVLAISPQHDALIELRRGAAGGDTLDSLHRLRLDPGAKFVGGKLDSWPASFGAGTFAQQPALVAAVTFGGTQYLIAGLCRDAAAYAVHRDTLKSAINSFHALNPKARLDARPHTLHLLTATADTRLAALAAKSTIDEAQLRLLNDLAPAGEPKPGRVLKVVD